MKKLILLSGLLLMLMVAGCTTEDPGYVIIDDSDPVSVSVDGNPEVKVVDADGDIVTIDEATRAITTIEYEHHEIHEGNSYILYVVSHDLDNADTLDLTVITANTTRWMHTVWTAEGTSAIHIYLYEDAVTNVAGGALTALNRDRNSSNTASATFREGDTFTALGDLIWEWHTGDKKVGGAGGERDEYILKQGTQYLFRIQSEADNNKVSGQVDFYEHTNRG